MKTKKLEGVALISVVLLVLVMWGSAFKQEHSLGNYQAYTCQFQSSDEVLCHDSNGALFKLFKRAPGDFTVLLPKESQ